MTERGVVERAAREAYGRLVASLSYRFRDIAAAEDAVGDALREALERWPETGVPRSPEAWLMAVAKNRLRERERRRAVADDPRTEAALALVAGALERQEPLLDERLRLLFVCAHPAIDPKVRTPLMLQVVLGLDAARIAQAFLVPAATMAQRLVRAKQKIRDAGLPFDAPEGPELDERIGAVLEAVYAAYGASWDGGADGLGDEALFLARLLIELVPASAEALGLFALIALSHARRRARFDDDGRFVPLAKHDVSRWDRDAIVHADRALAHAARLGRPGPFQLEAAIQSAHCQRLFGGSTPWPDIVLLYEALERHGPTVGVTVSHAAACLEAGESARAAALLGRIADGDAASYAPYWVVRAELARAIGDASGREAALARAVALTSDPRLRAHLGRQRSS